MAAVSWYYRGVQAVAALYPDDVAGAPPRDLESMLENASLSRVTWRHGGHQPARANYPAACTNGYLEYGRQQGPGEYPVYWFHRGNQPTVVNFEAETYWRMWHLMAAMQPPDEEEEAPAYIGPLDEVPGADWFAAYSQWALAAAWTDPVIKLQLSGGGAESDFSPVDYKVDVAAVNTFKGGNTALGKFWYDQTGNAKTAGQTTEGMRPTWIASSIGSLPSFRFAAGSNTRLVTASDVTLPDGAYTIFAVLTNTSETAKAIYCGMNYTGDSGDMLFTAWVEADDANLVDFDSSSDNYDTNETVWGGQDGVAPANTPLIVVLSLNDQQAIIRVNGVALNPVDGGTFGGLLGALVGPLVLGSNDPDGGSTSSMSGDMSEWMGANGLMSLPNIQLIEANMAYRYSITLP